MITCTIDTKGAQDALGALHDAMLGKGMDATNIVRDESRMLSKTIAAFTPPLGAGGGKGMTQAAKRAGEEAISRELENLISEAKPDFFGSLEAQFGSGPVDTYRQAKGSALKLHLLFDHLATQQAEIEQLHRTYLDRRGKIPLRKEQEGTWKARILVPSGERAPLITKLQSRVGWWKASWAYHANNLGAKITARWVTRHFSGVRANSAAVSDISGLQDPVKPHVIFGSRAKGNSRVATQVQNAVRFRANVIRRRVKLILSDYKDWRKVRERAEARKRGDPYASKDGSELW